MRVKYANRAPARPFRRILEFLEPLKDLQRAQTRGLPYYDMFFELLEDYISHHGSGSADWPQKFADHVHKDGLFQLQQQCVERGTRCSRAQLLELVAPFKELCRLNRVDFHGVMWL